MYKFIVILLLISSPALADGPWIEFEGSYTIGGKTLHDSPSYEKDNTHVRFTIHGDAAKRIYLMIEGSPMEDLCGIDHLTKVSGNIKCDYFDINEQYACYFGIGVKDNDVVKGALC